MAMVCTGGQMGRGMMARFTWTGRRDTDASHLPMETSLRYSLLLGSLHVIICYKLLYPYNNTYDTMMAVSEIALLLVCMQIYIFAYIYIFLKCVDVFCSCFIWK